MSIESFTDAYSPLRVHTGSFRSVKLVMSSVKLS